MTKPKTFNIKQVKAAFLSTFRGAGEVWFPYEDMGATIEEVDEGVDNWWQIFLENLTKEVNANH